MTLLVLIYSVETGVIARGESICLGAKSSLVACLIQGKIWRYPEVVGSCNRNSITSNSLPLCADTETLCPENDRWATSVPI